jgi:hypothetical protein
VTETPEKRAFPRYFTGEKCAPARLFHDVVHDRIVGLKLTNLPTP